MCENCKNFEKKVAPPIPGERITTIERLRDIFERLPHTWFKSDYESDNWENPFQITQLSGNVHYVHVCFKSGVENCHYFTILANLRVAEPPVEPPVEKTCETCGNASEKCLTCGFNHTSDNWTPKPAAKKKECQTDCIHYSSNLYDDKSGCRGVLQMCCRLPGPWMVGTEVHVYDRYKPAAKPVTAEDIKPGAVFENEYRKYFITADDGNFNIYSQRFDLMMKNYHIDKVVSWLNNINCTFCGTMEVSTAN